MAKIETLIVGNWKLHSSIPDAIKRVTELKTRLKSAVKADVAVAPPFTALQAAEVALQGSIVKLCGQNVYFEDEGAFTGEISAPMLRDVGCTYVLVGHSERRHVFQEPSEWMSRKVRSCIHADLIPILCVGEPIAERRGGRALEYVEEQVRRGIANLSVDEAHRLVLAYEPVWAIGTGETASNEQIQDMHQSLRNLISKALDKPTASAMRILYGGSVNPGNAKAILQQPDVNGLLVGGASLDPAKFAEIVYSAGE